MGVMTNVARTRLLRHCIAHNTLALPLQALCSDNLFLTKLCKYKHTSNP